MTTQSSTLGKLSFEQKLHNAAYITFIVFLIAIAIEGIRSLAGLPINPVLWFLQLAVIPVCIAPAILVANRSRRNKKARATAQEQGLDEAVEEPYVTHSFIFMPYSIAFETTFLLLSLICHWTARFTGSPMLEIVGIVGVLLYAGTQVRGISTWLAVRDQDKVSE